MWNPVGLTRPETNLPVERMGTDVPSLTGRGELTVTEGVHRSTFVASQGR